MTEVYVIRNQDGHYWGKSKAWVDGSEPRTVLRVKHEDEAVNTLFELSSKDYELRGEAVAVELSDRGEPLLEVSDIPLPVDPEEEAAEEVEAAEADAETAEVAEGQAEPDDAEANAEDKPTS